MATPRIEGNKIFVGTLPKNPQGATHGPDEVMRAVSAHLGETWRTVKLSGSWLVFCKQGSRAGQERRFYRGNFHKALAESTGLTVITETVR